MNSETSKLISDLLGSVSISELPQISSSEPKEDIYILTSTGNSEASLTPTLDVFNYLTHRVFSVMATTTVDEYGKLNLDQAKTILDNYSGGATKDPELIFGRYLYNNYRDQVCVETNGAIVKVICDYFLPDFQYFYFENLTKQKRTMLIHYTETSSNFTISTSQWESKLQNDSVTIENNNPGKPFLVIPSTALSNNIFKQRNYIKIVQGGNTNESGEDVLFGNTNERNDPDPDDEDRKPLGDIDATLNSIEKYIDDYAKILINAKLTFKGQVLVTTATTSQLANLYDDSGSTEKTWNSSIFNNKFFYANRSTVGSGGGNEVALSSDNLPSHNHHGEITQNIMIHGRPEGTTVGGVPVSKFISSTKASALHTSPDKVKHHSSGTLSPLTVIDASGSGDTTANSGPMTGSVVYDSSPVKHKNQPMYYTVKILVRGY